MSVELNNYDSVLYDGAADLYEVLDLQRGASHEDVKQAYRKLVLRYHPDKNLCDPEAAEKFKEISHANSILSDHNKRRIYDEHGLEVVHLAEQLGMVDLVSKFWFKAVVFVVTILTGCCCCFCCFGCCGRCTDLPQERSKLSSRRDPSSKRDPSST